MASTDLLIRFAGPQNKRQYVSPWRPGITLADLARSELPESGGFTAMVNGEQIDFDLWARWSLPQGSEIIFVPDFGFLAAILAWALPTIFTTAAMSSSVLGPITWAMVFNTIGWLGASYLINSLMPKPKVPKLEGAAGSPAQSWDPKTTQQEGLVIPRHYGTFRAHGNIITCFTAPSADGRKQLITALVAFADGPISSVTDIRVNGRQASNLSDLTTEVRLGNVSQSHVSFFDKTRLQYRYNQELTVAGGAQVFQMPDDDYDDLELVFRLNCWARRSNGAPWPMTVNFTAEISVRDSGSWTVLMTPSPDDSHQDLKWLEYKVSDYYALTRGVLYDIRVTKTGVDWDADRGQNQLWLESIKEVIDVAFTYPGMVLVGLSGMASEELPGFMDCSALLGPRVIDTYNGSSWTLADDSSDPAFAMWDKATLPLITGDGAGTPYAIDHYKGFSPSRLDATDFYNLSLFCATLVPDADGVDEPRVTCNIIFDYETNMWDAILTISEIARCLPVWNGNKLTLAINKAKTRSGIITVGNILNGTFEESFAPRIDAASEIDAEFNDAVRDYDRRTIPFHNPSLTNTENKISLSLPGLVKLTEVVRHIKQRLKQTELRRRTVIARCGRDALGYEVGDLLGVQEDVADWQTFGTRSAGHILSFSPGLAGYSDMLCEFHYKLNDNAWSTLIGDSSGNGNHGTSQRNTVRLHTNGQGGGAFLQDGSSDFIDTGDPFENIFQASFSVSLWAKPADGRPGSQEWLVGAFATAGNDNLVDLSVTTAGKLNARIITDGDAGNSAETASAVFADGPASDWAHIAIVFDSTIGGVGGKKIYVNGVEATLDAVNDGSTSGVTFADYTNAFNVFVGAINIDGAPFANSFFAGGLDNVLLFAKALSAAEITKLYNGGLGREVIDYDTVTLDQSVSEHMTPGATYELAVRLRNSSAPVLKTVLQASGSSVDLQTHFVGTVPRADDLWAIGLENLVLKDFTVEAVQRSGDLDSRLTLLEYDAAALDTDDELPLIPVSAAVIARVDRRLSNPLTRGELRVQVPAAAQEFPNIDVALVQNITWNDDTPSGGSISWSATDGDEPLLITWKGTTYEITAGNSANAFIYFDASAPTVFGSTNTLSSAYGGTKVPVCVNGSGTAVPVISMAAFHAAMIIDATITTAKIGNLQVTTGKIGAGAVTNAKLDDLSVSEAKVAANAISQGKIAALAVTEAKIGALAVTAAKIGALAVTTAKITDLNVTTLKIADSATSIHSSVQGTNTTTASASWTTVATAVISSSGGTVEILAQALISNVDVGVDQRVRVYNNTNSTTIFEQEYSPNAPTLFMSQGCAEIPGSGGRSYLIQMKSNGSASFTLSSIVLSLSESKGK